MLQDRRVLVAASPILSGLVVAGHSEDESRFVSYILRIDLRAGFDQSLDCLTICHARGQLQRRQVAERDGPVPHDFECRCSWR